MDKLPTCDPFDPLLSDADSQVGIVSIAPLFLPHILTVVMVTPMGVFGVLWFEERTRKNDVERSRSRELSRVDRTSSCS